MMCKFHAFMLKFDIRLLINREQTRIVADADDLARKIQVINIEKHGKKAYSGYVGEQELFGNVTRLYANGLMPGCLRSAYQPKKWLLSIFGLMINMMLA